MFHSFFQFFSTVEILISPFTFFKFYSMVSQDGKLENFADFLFFFFLLLLIIIVFWSGLGDPFVYQSPIGVYVCHVLGKVLGCAYVMF